MVKIFKTPILLLNHNFFYVAAEILRPQLLLRNVLHLGLIVIFFAGDEFA